jgi:hypothetical protein
VIKYDKIQMEEEEMNDFLDSFVYSLCFKDWLKVPEKTKKTQTRQLKKIEDVKEMSLFYIDNKTMLTVGENVYTAEPEKGEKFDAEKGFLICFAKAMGFSTTDILRIMNTARYYKSKPKAIKCDKVNKKR